MNEITSLQNSAVKETTALQLKKNRAESGLFLIEGFKGIEEALKSGLEIKHVFVDKTAKKSIEGISPEKIYFADEKIMKKISATETPPKFTAVARQVKHPLKSLFLTDNPLIIVLESIKDAGNFGTIIRTAKAANVSGIILTGNCTDIYNPKVVRASAANLWKLPVIHIPDTENLRNKFVKFGKFQILSTKVTDEENQKIYHEINYKLPTVILFGSESEGISEELSSQADECIKIPMNEEVESLNLSVSAGIIMYEASKQRIRK